MVQSIVEGCDQLCIEVCLPYCNNFGGNNWRKNVPIVDTRIQGGSTIPIDVLEDSWIRGR